jgi:hypothetical protein
LNRYVGINILQKGGGWINIVIRRGGWGYRFLTNRNPLVKKRKLFAPKSFAGLVNMVVPTIHTEGCPAVMILLSYLFLLSAISTALHTYRIRLKFW